MSITSQISSDDIVASLSNGVNAPKVIATGLSSLAGITITGGRTYELGTSSIVVQEPQSLTVYDAVDLHHGGALDFAGCRNLTYVDCDGTDINKIDIRGCDNLDTIFCGGNVVDSLYPISLPVATKFYFYDNSGDLKNMHIKDAPALTELFLPENGLETLQIDQKHLNLTQCWLNYNNLTEIDCSKFYKAVFLYGDHNLFTHVDASKIAWYSYFQNFSNCPNLKTYAIAPYTYNLYLDVCPNLRKINNLSSFYSSVASAGSVRVRNCNLSASELDTIFTDLPTANGTKTVYYGGNVGTAGADYTILTAKNWAYNTVAL